MCRMKYLLLDSKIQDNEIKASLIAIWKKLHLIEYYLHNQTHLSIQSLTSNLRKIKLTESKIIVSGICTLYCDYLRLINIEKFISELFK